MRKEDSTIVMGKDGYPLFWKSWPELYREAWLMGRRKRINEKLGFDLNEIVSEVTAKLKADRARAKAGRDRAEREKWLAQIKRWDREAILKAAINGAAQRLLNDKALAKPQARPAVRKVVAR